MTERGRGEGERKRRGGEERREKKGRLYIWCRLYMLNTNALCGSVIVLRERREEAKELLAYISSQ